MMIERGLEDDSNYEIKKKIISTKIVRLSDLSKLRKPEFISLDEYDQVSFRKLENQIDQPSLIRIVRNI